MPREPPAINLQRVPQRLATDPPSTRPMPHACLDRPHDEWLWRIEWARSMSSTCLPPRLKARLARAAPRFTAVVVFPTPPFRVAQTRTRGPARMRTSRLLRSRELSAGRDNQMPSLSGATAARARLMRPCAAHVSMIQNHACARVFINFLRNGVSSSRIKKATTHARNWVGPLHDLSRILSMTRLAKSVQVDATMIPQYTWIEKQGQSLRRLTCIICSVLGCRKKVGSQSSRPVQRRQE
jgi:hypothetical protein